MNCTQQTFNYSDWAEAQTVGVKDYVCLGIKNFMLQGHFYANNFSYVEVRLFRCANTSTSKKCASDDEIDAYFLKKRFNVAFVNNFFDIKEYGRSKVKSFLDDSLFWHIEVERQKKANFYIMKSNAQMYDDLF